MMMIIIIRMTIRIKIMNIKYKKKFSVNHVHYSQIKDAHHTSAKYASEISEFEKTELMEEYKHGKALPFVKNAPVQIECKYLNEYEINNFKNLLPYNFGHKVLLQNLVLFL